MGLWRVVAVAAALSCHSTTDAGGPSFPVTGHWDYVATQASPPAQLTGTLFISSQTGSMFQGTLDVVENDSLGGGAHLTGAVSGQTVDSMHVDFDVFLHPTARRHLGAVVGDSMTGIWVEPNGSSPFAGSFRARRVGP